MLLFTHSSFKYCLLLLIFLLLHSILVLVFCPPCLRKLLVADLHPKQSQNGILVLTMLCILLSYDAFLRLVPARPYNLHQTAQSTHKQSRTTMSETPGSKTQCVRIRSVYSRPECSHPYQSSLSPTRIPQQPNKSKRIWTRLIATAAQ